MQHIIHVYWKNNENSGMWCCQSTPFSLSFSSSLSQVNKTILHIRITIYSFKIFPLFSSKAYFPIRINKTLKNCRKNLGFICEVMNVSLSVQILSVISECFKKNHLVVHIFSNCVKMVDIISKNGLFGLSWALQQTFIKSYRRFSLIYALPKQKRIFRIYLKHLFLSIVKESAIWAMWFLSLLLC